MNEEAKSIFLVDDNEMFAETVKIGLMKDNNYNITIFATGEKMIDFLDKEKATPDIFILDFMLNSIVADAKNGAQILELLRTKYKVRIANAPVIMLTALTDVKEAVDLLKKGAKDYILKDSVFLDNLKKSLNNIIELKQLRSEMGLYKNQVKQLKKRLFLTLGVTIVFALVVVSYFIWF